MIELEPSFWNRTGRRNDKSARGHETALRLYNGEKKMSKEIFLTRFTKQCSFTLKLQISSKQKIQAKIWQVRFQNQRGKRMISCTTWNLNLKRNLLSMNYTGQKSVLKVLILWLLASNSSAIFGHNLASCIFSSCSSLTFLS